MMKHKNTIFAVLLVLAVLYIGDKHHWFRQEPAQAQGPAPYAECEKLRLHGDPGEKACYQRLSQSRDPWTRAEGLWGIEDYYNATTVFQEALKANDKDPARRVRMGLMFLERDQAADAQDLIEEALKLNALDPQALYAMALVLSDGYDGQATAFAEKALLADPKLYQARELIARIRLEDNNPEKAVEEAKKALEISPEALQALAILAAVDMLDDKPATQWTDQIAKVNPKYGQAYETIGHFFVINRRYDEGIAMFRKALELKPDLWSAKAELGVNLMRFGKDNEAYKQLESTFNDGPKPAVKLVKNTLVLMDSYKNFNTVETPTTILKLHTKEQDLLRPYFQSELDRAMATYEKKYKHKLTGPVQLEVYPDHADFEVRTMGMPGIGGILGVTFGQVVAMDSPNGRRPGDFHWASTLWHELSHVYVLSMTKSRTPRWFTEGVAVYEETASAPDWGDRLSPRELTAIKEKKLLPVADLDRGFIHPTYPEQVVVSYFQGGRVITYIVEKWGYDAVLGMIKGFADRKDTAQVINEVLKVTPEQFDAQFLPWLEAQTKPIIDGYDNWRKVVLQMTKDAQAKEWDKVIAAGAPIRDVYKEFVEPNSAYESLAEAYIAKGDKAKAIAELEAYASVGGRTPATLKQLADLQAEAGNKKAAAAAIEKLNLIFPKDEIMHQKLGNWYMDLNNPQAAVREFRAVLASGTIDLAGGHYNLARALRGAGKKDEALDEVYLALEAAPAYKPAQAMLLELSAQ